jgi:hypothetical protein
MLLCLMMGLMMGLMTGPAFGQSVDIPAAMDSDTKAPPTFAVLQYGHQFETDVEDGGGTTMAGYRVLRPRSSRRPR